jgi:lipoyl-dependent peroxiredoxin
MPERGQPTEAAASKVVYTAKTHTIGGRETGVSRSSDGHLDVKLSVPGSSRIGTNPEQLFAAAWSASFGSAIVLAARNSGVSMNEVTIDAELDLHVGAGNEHFLSARFKIGIRGVDRSAAQDLIRQAEKLCPYSRVTRGNISVTLDLLTTSST